MDYFDYLGATKQIDTKQIFEKYLINVLDYTTEQARKESGLYYRGE